MKERIKLLLKNLSNANKEWVVAMVMFSVYGRIFHYVVFSPRPTPCYAKETALKIETDLCSNYGVDHCVRLFADLSVNLFESSCSHRSHAASAGKY